MITLPEIRRSGALLALAAAWLLVSTAPALAHADLVRSDPAEGATLKRPPAQVQIKFNEPVEAEFSPLEVYAQGNAWTRTTPGWSPTTAAL